MVGSETFLTATLLFFLCTSSLAESVCRTSQNSSPDELVSYLTGVDAGKEANGECIALAIAKLRDTRYVPAIPAFAKLLDFRRPLDYREKKGIFLHIQSVGE